MRRPQPRNALAMMKGYHSPQLDVEVRLNTNESPFAPPEEFTRAFGEAMAGASWHRYPDRLAKDLRTRIASKHNVEPKQVFVANGSNEIIQTLLLTYGGGGRSAAVFQPTYAMHAQICRVSGTAIASGERSSNFAIDVDEVLRVADHHSPKVFFLCSPNNPTGVADPPEVVAKVLAIAQESGGLLCVDEAYGEFNSSSALGMLDEEVGLAVARTFSKAWAMAAARLGYLIGPSWLVAELYKAALPYHLSTASQIAGLLALDHTEAMQMRVEEVVKERERLQGELAKLDVEVWPSSANFVLFRTNTISGEQVWQQLLDRSVLVRNCASWPRLDGCLRVTVGTPQENDRFLESLSEVLT